MKEHLSIIGLLLTLYSCGPNAEEIKKREQFVADSTQAAIENKKAIQDSIQLAEQKQKELAEKNRIHEEKIEVGKSIKRTKLNNYLKEIESKLSQEKRRLSQINEFQIGRSSSTKSQQLAEQRKAIRQIEEFKEGLEYEISHAHLHQSYDFQTTPKGTIKHLIKSAETEDYSKLRNLVDPYGEFDRDAFAICLVEMYPDEIKTQWKNEFASGRIMGASKISRQTAEIEIAIGISSNKLETIHLVQRQDKWYIQSFLK
jgi:hypothetical protein